MTDPVHPDVYAALAAKHGDRMPAESEVFIREGWFALVDRLLTDLTRDYPDARILALTAAGWLHIDYSLPSDGRGWTRHVTFDRWLQTYISESLWTCECCGSRHGRDRRGRRVICDKCEPETCSA